MPRIGPHPHHRRLVREDAFAYVPPGTFSREFVPRPAGMASRPAGTRCLVAIMSMRAPCDIFRRGGGRKPARGRSIPGTDPLVIRSDGSGQLSLVRVPGVSRERPAPQDHQLGTGTVPMNNTPFSNPFEAASTIRTPLGARTVHRLDAVRDHGDINSLPYSIKVLLESALRNCERTGCHRGGRGDARFVQRRQGARVRNPVLPPVAWCYRTSPGCPPSSTWPP